MTQKSQNIINKNSVSHPYIEFAKTLESFPFILIIGKYDHTLGPRALYSSIHLKDETFVRNLLRDALNTKNRFVILDFNQFYSQIYKVEIEDPSARGGKQLYAIIILRDIEYPLIPILHFKRIVMIFRKIDHKKILLDDVDSFDKFFHEVNEIYMRKDEILPLESINLQIRSGINTIQGFCQLLSEQMKKQRNISKNEIQTYIEMMLDSCKDIVDALEKPVLSAQKNNEKC
ncbi:MAG: hypothetical protein ACFFDX_15870 [Candidatus Odinarchaeota archaeon]